MGIFIDQLCDERAHIQEDKREELARRMEVLFQAGGMMEVHEISLYNIRITSIRKIHSHQNGLDAYYNYFEDEIWENAGFNKEESYVWSGKVGYGPFARTVLAAYTLQELYTDGLTVTLYNGSPVASWAFVGWINYLFQERYHIKNFDQWNLFEFVREQEYLYEEEIDWMDFGVTRYAFIGGCEIYAVLNGVDKAIEKYSEVEKGDLENSIFISMKNLLVALEDVKSNSTLDIELQINNLLSKICLLYEVDFKEKTKEIFDECDYEWIRWLELCDAPALCIKKIAEMYERDFWEIWDRVKRLIKRRATALYGNEEYNVLPISTEKFFKVVEDDMIAFWKDNDNFKFSKELCEWFEEIKKQLLEMSFPQQEKEYSLKYVMSLLKQMEDKYKVYVFSDFFEETIENLNDERYVKLWFICENLLNKVENEMPEDHKMRKRVLRRYMAVIGNKNLRQTLFGF